MYNNVGKKIKGVALFFCWLGIIAAVITAIVIWTVGLNGRSSKGASFLVGLLVIAVGSLLAWLGSMLLYGFGELIDKVSSIERKLGNERIEKSSLISGQDKSKNHMFNASSNIYGGSRTPGANEKKCPNCGSIEAGGHNVCYKCGYKFY